MKASSVARTCIAATAGLGLLVCSASASETGHYAPGIANVRGIDIPAPGLYGALYAASYRSDDLRDREGRSLDSVLVVLGETRVPFALDVELEVDSVSATLVWASRWTLFGGRYSAFASPTLARVRVRTSAVPPAGPPVVREREHSGLADLYLQPLLLTWTREQVSWSLGYGLYAPIGRYDVERAVGTDGVLRKMPAPGNSGLGFWTHQLQSSATWNLPGMEGLTLSGMLTYELHQRKRSLDVRPGSDLTLNVGVAQLAPINGRRTLLLELGCIAYAQGQVADDRGRDAVDGDVHDRVYAAGVEIGVISLASQTSLKLSYLREFGARDRFEGSQGTLKIVQRF